MKFLNSRSDQKFSAKFVIFIFQLCPGNNFFAQSERIASSDLNPANKLGKKLRPQRKRVIPALSFYIIISLQKLSTALWLELPITLESPPMWSVWHGK